MSYLLAAQLIQQQIIEFVNFSSVNVKANISSNTSSLMSVILTVLSMLSFILMLNIILKKGDFAAKITSCEHQIHFDLHLIQHHKTVSL